MQLNSFQDLFTHELQDLYDAETRIVATLPKMVSAASDPDLRDAFSEHLQQTRMHVERLQRIFDELGTAPGGVTCAGIAGILKEGDEIFNQYSDPEVRDAALIGAAQRVEHYEMAAYGTVRTFADQMDKSDWAGILQDTLNEEGAADKKLSKIAERRVNKEAFRQAA